MYPTSGDKCPQRNVSQGTGSIVRKDRGLFREQYSVGVSA